MPAAFIYSTRQGRGIYTRASFCFYGKMESVLVS